MQLTYDVVNRFNDSSIQIIGSNNYDQCRTRLIELVNWCNADTICAIINN